MLKDLKYINEKCSTLVFLCEDNEFLNRKSIVLNSLNSFNSFNSLNSCLVFLLRILYSGVID